MIVRLKLAIPQEEYSALLKLSLIELRNPESQLQYIMRKELRRYNLLNNSEGPLLNQSIGELEPTKQEEYQGENRQT